MSIQGSINKGDGRIVQNQVPPIDISASREAHVGRLLVRRALPRRERRTVGAWCFADHMGPIDVTNTRGVDVGPHPHMGLQTVTMAHRRNTNASRQPGFGTVDFCG